MRFFLFLFLCSSVFASPFQLADYENVAITTDLEPDDVLALKIIFEEADRLHCRGRKYPIQLVIVGEGNSDIKKARMEKLLRDYYKVPVPVEVKSGRSTGDNLFPYDGEELGEKYQYPIPQNEEGSDALIRFVQESTCPLIIHLKPVHELVPLSFQTAIAKKVDLICYGSFNFRKALLDDEMMKPLHFTARQPLPVRLQMMLDHFAASFHKIGIVETFGVLENQGSVFCEYPWTHPIIERINLASDPFYTMFKLLVCNWNRYKFNRQLVETADLMNEISSTFPHTKKDVISYQAQLLKLAAEWNREHFFKLMAQLEALPSHQELKRHLSFLHKVNPCAGLQFTLSDVILALALIDPFFTASPVKVTMSSECFLQTSCDLKSNVFYYDRKDYCKFTEILLKKLKME